MFGRMKRLEKRVNQLECDHEDTNFINSGLKYVLGGDVKSYYREECCWCGKSLGEITEEELVEKINKKYRNIENNVEEERVKVIRKLQQDVTELKKFLESDGKAISHEY